MVVEQLKQKDGNFLDYQVNMKTIQHINQHIKTSQNQLKLSKENKLNKNLKMVKVKIKEKFDFKGEMEKFAKESKCTNTTKYSSTNNNQSTTTRFK